MDRVIRERACREATGLSRTTRWRMEKKGDFPRHLRLSANAVGWLESEIAAWIKARVGERDASLGISTGDEEDEELEVVVA